ncbi:unnamed protein product [Amaranthus hypochondriacus]
MADDNDASPEDLDLDGDDIMMNVEPSAEEDSNNSIDQRNTDFGIADEGEADIANNDDKGSVPENLEPVSVGERNMECGIVEEIKKDKSVEGSTEDVVKNSLTEESDLATGRKKNSALVIVGSNHKFNVRSRYLSDSFASCHDFCKYGHKHESEKQTKRLTLRTIRESQPLKKTTSDDLEACVLKKAIREKDLHRRLSLPGPIPEKSPLMRVEGGNLSKKDVNLPKLKRVQSEIKTSSVQCPGSSSRNKSDTGSVMRTMSQNLRKSPTPKTREVKTWKVVGSRSVGEKEVKENGLMGSSLNTSAGFSKSVKEIKAKEPMQNSLKTSFGFSKSVKAIKAKEPMSNSPKTPLKKSSSFKARLYKNRKSSSFSKVEGLDSFERTLSTIESMANVESETNPDENVQNSPPAARTRKTQEPRSTRKGIGASLLSFSSQESSRQQGEKNGSRAGKNKLRSNKTEDSGSKTTTPRAKSTVAHRLTQDGRSKPNTQRENPTVDPKLKPKKKEKTHSEEKDASSWKVKFKRGTVVALQVANNAPKKLRFKRGKILGEEQNSKADVKQLNNEYDKSTESNDKLGPEKVRLRHQEASGKKDDVDLNNVIEETASKLVKTRKSKVKALVGAFETVMSLHDRKRPVEISES